MCFHSCFRLFLDNRIEKLLLVPFLWPLLIRQMVENLCVLFGPHCIISAYTQDYELKLVTYSDLKSEDKFLI